MPQGAPGGTAAAAGGTPDYSQQWIEYYRSQGMNSEADKIEQQLKASKVSWFLSNLILIFDLWRAR